MLNKSNQDLVSRLQLRELNENDEPAFLSGLKDWKSDELFWYTFLWKPDLSFSDHLRLLKEAKNKDLIADHLVPSTMLYAFVDNKIVGRLNVRHELNTALTERGGHLGYAVGPNHRGLGYATAIYKQGLKFCSDLGLQNILVTCSDDNLASWKIIEKFGARLENKIFDEVKKEYVRRYWVDIQKALISATESR